MSWHTNSAVLLARNMGRLLGLNRILAKLETLNRRGYEENYDARLSSCIRRGDTVWDIGANVGYYTTQFANRVGATGAVVAFEPSALNFARLMDACTGLGNVSLHRYGLGNAKGQYRFKQGEDILGADSQIANDGESVVDVQASDELVGEAGVPPPNVIKMDVEGFEGEVMQGLRACLASSQLHTVGIEIHFGILTERGRGQTPHVIETMLKDAGFNVSWPDRNHIIATRRA